MGNVDAVKKGAQSFAQKAKDINPYAKYYLILTVALAAITLAGLLTANHFGMSPSELFSFKATQITTAAALGLLYITPLLVYAYNRKKASDQAKAHASHLAAQSQGSDPSAILTSDVPATARARPASHRPADLPWTGSMSSPSGHSFAAAPVMGPPPPLPAGVDPDRLPTPVFTAPPPAPASTAAASVKRHEVHSTIQHDPELPPLNELRKCLNPGDVISWKGVLIVCSKEENGYLKPAKAGQSTKVLALTKFARRWQQHFPTRPLPSFLTSHSRRDPASASAAVPVASAAGASAQAYHPAPSPGIGPAGPAAGPFPSGPIRDRDFGETLRRFAPVAEAPDFINALGDTLTHDTCAVFQDQMDNCNVKIIIKRTNAIIVVSLDKILDMDQSGRLEIVYGEVLYAGQGKPTNWNKPVTAIYTILNPAVMQPALAKYAQDKANGVARPYRTGMVGTAV